MSETVECIYVENVLKPVAPLHLSEGERVIVHIEKKISFDTIKLITPISRHEIRSLRDESFLQIH